MGFIIHTQAQVLMPTQQEFGQNRIQSKEYKWKVLVSSNFELYFYGDGQNVAQNALLFAEAEYERLAGLLGYSPYSRSKIFFYNSPSDLYQSNANLNLTGQINQLESNLSKSKIEVAYSGDIASFKKVLINKIAEIFVFEMLYGGSLKDALQSSILLTLPEWFIQGVSAYAAEGWSNEMDEFMRDAIQKKRMKRPEKLSGNEARLFGQSIWNYIAERYGKDYISNILNLTRIIRNEQTSLGSTLGTSYNKFLKEWRDYYAGQLTQLNGNYSPMRSEFKLKPNIANKDTRYISARMSPDQSLLAYVTEENGQHKVQVYSPKTKKNQVLLKQGLRSINKQNNTSSPEIAWAKGNKLVIIYEKGDAIKLNIVEKLSADKVGGKITMKRELKGLQQVNTLDIADDGKLLIMSAVKKNQNDIYLYDMGRAGLTQITNDIYDDRQPNFVPNTRQSFVYLSNRPVDTVVVEKNNFKTLNKGFGLFFHEGTPRTENIRLLADSLGNVSKPTALDDSTAIFLSDEKGILNLYKYAKGDSTIQRITQITNSNSNIYDYDFNPTNKSLAYISFEEGGLYIGYLRRLDTDAEFELPSLAKSASNAETLSKLFPKQIIETNVDPLLEEEEKDQIETNKNLANDEIDTDNYRFEPISQIKTEPKSTRSSRNPNTGIIIKSNAKKDSKIKGPTDFKDKIELINPDFNFVIDPLRGLAIQSTAIFSDVLQNQIFKAGALVTPNLRKGDLFLDYNNYTKRIDYGVRFDRRSYTEEFEGITSRKFLYNRIEAKVSYPFSVVSKITFAPFGMVSSTKETIPSNNNEATRFGGWRLEYMYDNTSQTAPNVLEGTRFRTQYQSVTAISAAKESFAKIGFDLRNYKKLPTDIIFATRLSYGRSTGNAPKQYILGGMDNWANNSMDVRSPKEDPINADGGNNRNLLLFSDFVTNMRGFNYNKTSGTNFALLNAEFRFPLFKYLSAKPSNTSFFSNFQATIFSDIGTVWNKRNPLKKKNDFNTKPIDNALPFGGNVTDFKSPLLASYGFGARSAILGYFVKADIAWGVEDNQVLKPITYITIGYDF